MPATTRSPVARPHSAPAYYLGRPASMWIIALGRRPHGPLPDHSAADPDSVGHPTLES